jgi:DeoR family transcriptional regulator, suf operon transcriptional repressor
MIAPMRSNNAEAATPGPLGHRGVRGTILLELKKAGSLTTRELSSRLRVSPNAVRHHLKDLEEQELVEYQRLRRGVGAPTFAYRLARAAEALFPRRYETILLNVLSGVIRAHGRAEAVALLEEQFTGTTARLEQELADVEPEERLERLASLLSEQGYMAEASPGRLVQHNCAIQEVAQQFPEICAAEARFLSAVLNADVRRERHILSGCTACEYRVRFSTPVVPLEENA